MRATILLSSVLAPAVVASPARADLTGSLVAGTLSRYETSGNFFDPASGFVPSTGFENSSSNYDSPVVPISNGAIEFGEYGALLQDHNATFADFGSSTLTLTVNTNEGDIASTYTFTDFAFYGLTVTTTSDTFIGGATAVLSGITLTITTPEFDATGTFGASYTFSPATATPEPSNLIFGGLAGLAGIGYARRRRAAKALT